MRWTESAMPACVCQSRALAASALDHDLQRGVGVLASRSERLLFMHQPGKRNWRGCTLTGGGARRR